MDGVVHMCECCGKDEKTRTAESEKKETCETEKKQTCETEKREEKKSCGG